MPHPIAQCSPRRLTRLPHGLGALLLAPLLVLLPQVPARALELPDMGASASTLMSPSEEQRLGQAFMRGIRRSLPVIEDPLLTEYIENLGRRLAGGNQRDGRRLQFFLIDQPVINAFAGPAGHVGVFAGLVLATENESELAAVVAHEIAHVTQDHLLRALENARNMSIPAAALMLAAIALGAAASSDAALAAATGLQAGILQQQINFTRDNEQEADRVGIEILASAHFDPRAMPAFFERLAKTSRLYENSAPEFLRTHPVTTHRISEAISRAEGHAYRQRPDDPSYYQTRAALRARSFNSPREAVNHFAKTLKEARYRDEDAERYGYALALLRDRQYPAAAAQATRLLSKSPTSIPYLLLQARIHKGAGQTRQALATVGTALELFPGNYPLSQFHAELLLEQRRPAEAEKILAQALERRPDEPNLYELRSRAAAAAGRKGDAHLYLAETHYLSGQLEQAVQQLQTALRSEKLDFYDASRIQAKLRAYKEELAEEKKASRKGG